MKIMAEAAKITYPVIPVKHWWSLRERFKKSIPAVVNENYIASVLGMSEKSAKSNIIPSLKYTGIIDEEGKPTNRAIRWRDDVHYSEVCEEIRKEVYPQELLDIALDPETDKDKAKRWFANSTGSGESAINRILAVYLLLIEADVNKSQGETPVLKRENQKSADRTANNATKRPATSQKAEMIKNTQDETQSDRASAKSGPSLHLDIQIHISPDSSPEQIDQIFASMAKHLKDFH